MALTGSGQISISDIRNEFQTANGSLGTLSDNAGFSAPDAMSDFYGYSAYNLVVSYVSAGSPCNAADQNVYQNVGNGKYYAQDAYSPGAYTLVNDISSAWFLYSYYDFWFDAYVYNEYETNAASDAFDYLGDTLSACAPS